VSDGGFYMRLVFFARAMLSTELSTAIDQHVFIQRFMRELAWKQSGDL
jgi:hypothetical protein